MNGDEYLALEPWFCWSHTYLRCRLPPFATINPLPAARNHISLLAYTCCLCRSVPTFSWDVAIRAIECTRYVDRGCNARSEGRNGQINYERYITAAALYRWSIAYRWRIVSLLSRYASPFINLSLFFLRNFGPERKHACSF